MLTFDQIAGQLRASLACPKKQARFATYLHEALKAMTGESEWAHLYEKRRWRRRSRRQLGEKPFCEECLKRGLVVQATASHHIIPHNGDLRLFFEGALLSVCGACHNRKRPIEKGRKPKPVIGPDGWPLPEPEGE